MNKKVTAAMIALIVTVAVMVLLMISPLGSHYFKSCASDDVEGMAEQIAKNADVTAEKVFTQEDGNDIAVLVLDTEGGQHFATYSKDSLFKSRWSANADSLVSYAKGELDGFTTATIGTRSVLYGTGLPEDAAYYSYRVDGATVEDCLDGNTTILEFVAGTVTDCQLLDKDHQPLV